jgi:hypothetical protein
MSKTVELMSIYFERRVAAYYTSVGLGLVPSEES